MRIDDERQRTAWMPAREVLEQVVPLLPKEYLVGVRRLLLLDDDYHGRKEAALARYVAIRGTRGADIELYFAAYESLPADLRENRPYWAMVLTATLGHELYHHLVRGQKRRRRPSFEREQAQADRWGSQYVRDVVLRLYPREQYRADYETVHRQHEECPECSRARDRSPDGARTPP